MLEKPVLADALLAASLKDAYGIAVDEVQFLPWGADAHSAVYRVRTSDRAVYFVKLRSGNFVPTTITVPALLHEKAVPHLIAPLRTQHGLLWFILDRYWVTVFPFVEGQNGYAIPLTPAHWRALGRSLKGCHTAVLPPDMRLQIPQETYASTWREQVRHFQHQAQDTTFADSLSAGFADLLNTHTIAINRLLRTADALADDLRERLLPYVLCHADIHAGNILVDDADQCYLVDWDTMLMAPKERDLMSVGGGLGGGWMQPEAEAQAFYQGYGETDVDGVALVYYRYERIIQDIAAYTQEVMLTSGDSPDRAAGLAQLSSQFGPGGVIEIAFGSEAELSASLRGK
jgi:spectinomycin phosphotransferase